MSTSNPTTSTAAASSDSKQAVALLPSDVRCSYPSKLCNSHRATKDNGDLHKLCDFHRKKANVNQQRMQHKRRLIRQQMLERKKRFMETAQAPDCCSTTNTCREEPDCEFSLEDLVILNHFLFDDDDVNQNSMLKVPCNPSCMMYPGMHSGNMSL
ncbi:Hypothetical protein PHPALM_16744 [Phytophthora palmivora]|uniref:Uncharacterized protein n=1 Tax=Phytophthora palmivora TaxID=4796 RepID=A0A2P4XP05_9STRA|nr:Hypothetical protein PHPALM_16744 [Phytophthora palmivora]